MLDAYRYQVAQFRVAEAALRSVVAALESSPAKPLLGKGWAVAALYGEPRARPVGDLDLYVDPSLFPVAASALEPRGAHVDLHAGCAELGGEPWPAVESRAIFRTCGAAAVRCFGGADHLRLVARHMFRHGAWRPLWLCDVAVLVEAGDVDWNLALAGDRVARSWTLAAARLSVRLLGARPDESAPPEVSDAPPGWLESALLEAWGRPIVAHGLRKPMALRFRDPVSAATGLLERWPNPIEAAIEMGRAADEPPRPFEKSRAALRRTRRFLQSTKDVTRG